MEWVDIESVNPAGHPTAKAVPVPYSVSHTEGKRFLVGRVRASAD